MLNEVYVGVAFSTLVIRNTRTVVELPVSTKYIGPLIGAPCMVAAAMVKSLALELRKSVYVAGLASRTVDLAMATTCDWAKEPEPLGKSNMFSVITYASRFQPSLG